MACHERAREDGADPPASVPVRSHARRRLPGARLPRRQLESARPGRAAARRRRRRGPRSWASTASPRGHRSGSRCSGSGPCPVPAGIRRPMITFSLRPRRWSTLPQIAASVSTLVVSWKEAAEMNDSVESEALVMPSSSGSAIGRLPRPPPARARSPPRSATSRPARRPGSRCRPTSLIAHPAQHLAHDHLDVLVVDLHALQAVDLLHLVDQVLRELLLALDRAGCRAGSTSRPSAARPARTRSPSCTLMCLPFGIRYSRGSPAVGRHDHAALAARRRCRTTTMPSISETIANSFGLRASKSSATRGRPPVMSLVLVDLARDLRDARRRRRPRSPSRRPTR